jgi:hypothetical protein
MVMAVWMVVCMVAGSQEGGLIDAVGGALCLPSGRAGADDGSDLTLFV